LRCGVEVDGDSGSDSGAVFDMECQNMGTHVAGIPPQPIEPSPDASVTQNDQSAETRAGNY